MKFDLRKSQKLLLVCLLATLMVSLSVWAFARSKQRTTANQSQRKQITTKSGTNLVRKSADLSAETGNGKETVLTLNLVGFAEQDIINLKAGDNKIEAVAFRMVKSDCVECPQTLNFGPELSVDSLVVTSQGMSFVRPTNAQDDVIILDIEVPTNVQVKLIKNGEIIVAAKVDSPILMKNGKLKSGIGKPSTKKLAMWASMPIIQEKGFPQEKNPNK